MPKALLRAAVLMYFPFPEPLQGDRCPMVFVFLAIGVTAGVLSGLFGIGGGVLIIPSLIFFAKFHTKLAIGTSLGAMLLPVGLLGAYAYYQEGNVNVKASLLIGLGLFLGAYVGARLAQTISGTTLQRMFAVFILLMAIRLWVEAGRG
ncbi:MAG TPA: sulfite exporter TauE/SafE family protein [Gemmatimonadales bacterium]|nr:sulfite exporter TauE/SafE family protein [Gemmatimonadales bacterium]